MLTVANRDFGKTLDFGENFPDGRLTEPSDGNRYEWRKND